MFESFPMMSSKPPEQLGGKSEKGKTKSGPEKPNAKPEIEKKSSLRDSLSNLSFMPSGEKMKKEAARMKKRLKESNEVFKRFLQSRLEINPEKSRGEPPKEKPYVLPKIGEKELAQLEKRLKEINEEFKELEDADGSANERSKINALLLDIQAHREQLSEEWARRERQEKALGPIKEELKKINKVRNQEQVAVSEEMEAAQAKLRRKKDIPRQAAEVTLRRVKKYEDLDAPTAAEREKIFQEKTRELWNHFAIQGLLNSKTGRIDTFSDLDGKSALGILRLAKIIDPENHVVYSRTVEKKSDRSEIKVKTIEGETAKKKKLPKILSFVPAGEVLPGAIHIDTGHREGVVSDEDASAFFDHHGPESGLDSSATKKVHESLLSLGLIEKDPALEKLVEFVTNIDNGTFPNAEKYFMDFHRTALGLERYLSFTALYKFFKDGHEPTDLLTESELKKYGLDKGSTAQKAIEEKASQEFQNLEKSGMVIPIKNGGKALIVINGKFSGGYLGASYFGAKIYVIWNPKEKSFFVSNNSDLAINLSQGKNIRGKMWIKPRHDKEPLRITLKSLIDQIASPDFVPTEKLKEYLSQETSNR